MTTNSRKPYILRGFVKPVAGQSRYVAVCLRPNLVAEGSSEDEAYRALRTLIEAYVADAEDEDRLDYFMSLRAPASLYLEYWAGLFAQLANTKRTAILTFAEPCPCSA